MPYKNPILATLYSKDYRERNRERIQKRVAKWQKLNPGKVLRYKAKWARENTDKIRAAEKRRYLRDPSKVIGYVKTYQKRHPERVAAQRKKYRENNREKVRRAQNNWQAKQMSDVNFRIKKLLRGRTGIAIKAVNGAKKCAKTIEMLGCSIEDFRIYIESKFDTGMTWQNYGSVWHVDHIMPCAIFDLTKPEHQKRCFHFSNMQPLFVVDNLKKNRWNFSDQFNLL